ncbi:MAG TPA: hypothetical protein VFH31_07850 [Pyrinomonadaceae bacterium]|nr:hypothetical protein [Pyrinomonadaceae bacterium]
MSSHAMVRRVLTCTLLCLSVMLICPAILAQDVGADVGGGAGIFRPKIRKPRNAQASPRQLPPGRRHRLPGQTRELGLQQRQTEWKSC